MADRLRRALTRVVLAMVSARSAERAVTQRKLTKGTPQIAREGTGYMTSPGGSYGSNTDPFATKATPDNDWGYDPPHVMLLVPDPRALEGIPTKRQGGGPWVMWPGTAYAHIMVPLTSPKK